VPEETVWTLLVLKFILVTVKESELSKGGCALVLIVVRSLLYS